MVARPKCMQKMTQMCLNALSSDCQLGTDDGLGPCENSSNMTTEYFIQLRTAELRRFFRGYFGRRWRYRAARRMGRKDVPRWLASKKCPATLRQLIPVEKLANILGYRPSYPPSAAYARWLLDDYRDLAMSKEPSEAANNHPGSQITAPIEAQTSAGDCQSFDGPDGL